MCACRFASASFFVLPPALVGFAIFSAYLSWMACVRMTMPAVQCLCSRFLFGFCGSAESSGSSTDSLAISHSSDFARARNRPRAALSPPFWRNLTGFFAPA